ncbi:unnamed protein product [Pleuronectes platessa]|uniref:Uncharacterized protein n=1 Tax=Pleuronectes platessa TaxID=8262 RepID=A0A9N7U614_PLEPL|nr:unnamed protein product [Pleuronectes platessa]
MLLLLPVTGYPSYSAPYFPVNSKVDSVRQNPGSLGQLPVSKSSPGGCKRDDRNLPLSAQVHSKDLPVLHGGPVEFILKHARQKS